MEISFKKSRPIKILFQGWLQIPHSYAIVNCFQLVHLYKNYGQDKIDIYVEEMPYFIEEWNNKKMVLYSEEYNTILKQLKTPTKEDTFDLIYRHTYPYNITNDNVNIPKCIFYTSEYKDLNPDNFIVNDSAQKTNETIAEFLKEHKNIYFTTPSIWSSKGLEKYNISNCRNQIITHGVDTNIFYKLDDHKRKEIRGLYNIKDEEIVFFFCGAMTKNKGIMYVLHLLYILVYKLGKTYYRLILKGTGDIYPTELFLKSYFEEFVMNNVITIEEINNLCTNNIIFINQTLNFPEMNQLYNASDLYLAPYTAEGFALTPLEALASGLSILVPETGSTKEYIELLYRNGGSNLIYYVKSIEEPNENHIELQDLLNTIFMFEKKTFKPK
jgi:glycosyltransferase involved in cell wall biosynthesis